MICQVCGIEAPTKKVSFHQNIGLLVMRLYKSVDGYLCKPCIHGHFWKFTLTTLFLGPWGMISLVLSPFFIINNIFVYLFALGLEPPPPGAGPPVLTDEAIERLKPQTEALFRRLDAGEPLPAIAADVGPRTGVTPGQVVLYVGAVIEASRARGS